MEKKYIELEVVYSGETFVAFRIAKQSHRGESFGREYPFGNSREYKAENGVTLQSNAGPEFTRHCNTLHVQGGRTDFNNKVLEVSKSDFTKIEAAVKEYNEFFDVKMKLADYIKEHGWKDGYKYAAVDGDGGGWQYTEKPQHGFVSEGWVPTSGVWERIGENFDASDWQNSLIERYPKLTTDIFNHPECPKDARIAVVNKYGWAHWGSYKDANEFFDGFSGIGRGKWTRIPGEFDGLDYPNTIIRNPKFEQWKPAPGEKYWSIGHKGGKPWVDYFYLEDDKFDQNIMKSGLAFQTEEKAEAFLEILKPKLDKVIKESLDEFNKPLEYPDVT